MLDRMMRRPIWGQGDGAQNTVRHIKTSGELANFVSRLGGEGNSKKGRAAHPGTPPSAAVCLWLMCELWRRGRLLEWMKGGQGREISQFDKQKKRRKMTEKRTRKGVEHRRQALQGRQWMPRAAMEISLIRDSEVRENAIDASVDIGTG